MGGEAYSVPALSPRKLASNGRSASTASNLRPSHSPDDDRPVSARTPGRHRRSTSTGSGSPFRLPSKETKDTYEGIRTFARIRPVNTQEEELQSRVVSAEGRTVHLDTNRGLVHFSFDHVFGAGENCAMSNASQEEVFRHVGEPLLRGALAGESAWIVALGQAGAGKSHTNVGSPSRPGILPQFVERLVGDRSSSPNVDHLLWLSALEINNEYVRDLLSVGAENAPNSERPSFVEHPMLGVQVVGLQQAPCPNLSGFWRLLDYATKKRALSSTCVHAENVQSHLIYYLRLEVRHGRRTTQSRLGFAEVGGVFRTPRRQASRSNIALNVLVRELVEASSRRSSGDPAVVARHLPFSATKLTLALKDALVSSVQTCVLAAISPADTAAAESQAVLQLVDMMRGLRQCIRLRGMEYTHSQELPERQRSTDEALRVHHQHADEYRRASIARERALEARGVAMGDAQQACAAEQVTPYFLNMSDDPMLAGSLMFILRRGEPTYIGSDPSNGIVVDGLGATAELCHVINHDNVMVSLHKSGGLRRQILVNGMVLPAECTSVELRHRDRLCLGRAMLLRLQVPMHAQVATIDESAEFTGRQKPPPIHELVLRDAAQEIIPALPDPADSFKAIQPFMDHSDSLSELRLYVKDLLGKFDSGGGRMFFETLQEACLLVDEANLISYEVRPQDKLHFEVEFVWDIYRTTDEVIMIRLMQDDEFHEHAEILTYWTYARFRERIAEMRRIHHVFHHTGAWSGKGDPLDDPWEEPQLVDFHERHFVALVGERRRTIAMVAQRTSSPKRPGASPSWDGCGSAAPSSSEPVLPLPSMPSPSAGRVKTPRVVSSRARVHGDPSSKGVRLGSRARPTETNVAAQGAGGNRLGGGPAAPRGHGVPRVQARSAPVTPQRLPSSPSPQQDPSAVADDCSPPGSPSSERTSLPSPREEQTLNASNELSPLASVARNTEDDSSQPLRSDKADGESGSVQSCDSTARPSPPASRLASPQRHNQPLLPSALSGSATLSSSIAFPCASSTPILPGRLSDMGRPAHGDVQPACLPQSPKLVASEQPQASVASPASSPGSQSRPIRDRFRSGSVSPPSGGRSQGVQHAGMPSVARLHHAASAPRLPIVAHHIPIQQAVGFQSPHPSGIAVAQHRVGHATVDFRSALSPRLANVRRAA